MKLSDNPKIVGTTEFDVLMNRSFEEEMQGRNGLLWRALKNKCDNNRIGISGYVMGIGLLLLPAIAPIVMYMITKDITWLN